MAIEDTHRPLHFPENEKNGRDKAAAIRSFSTRSQAAATGVIADQDVVFFPQNISGGGWRVLSDAELSGVRNREIASRRLETPTAYLVIKSRMIASVQQRAEKKSAKEVVRPSGPLVLFKKIMDDWHFSDNEAAVLLGYDDPFAIVELYTGATALRQRDAKDRLRTVLAVAADLDALFRSELSIRAWLSEQQPMLRGKSPKELLTEGSMENLLRVRQYVEFISGR